MNKQKGVTLVAVSGMSGNILLLIAKLTVGFISNSQAMIADGLNSAGDVFASAITFLGNKIATKPGDNNHPYGHGKAEYIFSMIISFSLLLVAFSIFRNAYDALTSDSQLHFSYWLIIVALGTIVLKFFLFLFARKIGKKYNSLLALANSEDHRNDVFVSTLTLVSTVCGYYNIHLVDGIAGILISFWIAFTGIKIFTRSYSVLMDTTVNAELTNKMKGILTAITGVDHIDAIISKPIGLNFVLIVEVSVDANLTVYEGHEISDEIRNELLKLDNIEDVIVHINPAQYHPQSI